MVLFHGSGTSAMNLSCRAGLLYLLGRYLLTYQEQMQKYSNILISSRAPLVVPRVEMTIDSLKDLLLPRKQWSC